MHISRFLFALSVLTSVVGVSRAALADDDGPARTFGDKERFALGFNEGVTLNASDLLTNGELQASYFVIPRLSLGIALGAQWLSDSPTSNAPSSSTFVFHAGPRVGYDLAIADRVSIWPQVGVDYRNYTETSVSTTDTGTATGVATTQNVTSTSSAFGLTAMVPVLIHPTRGFFVGGGPVFYTEFSNSTSTSGQSTDNSKITSLGLVFTIGGAI
jgi:hypothetical protein